MAGVDSVLNFMIGPIIFVGVIWLFREPIKGFTDWIKSMIDKGRKNGDEGGFTNGGFGNIEYE